MRVAVTWGPWRIRAIATLAGACGGPIAGPPTDAVLGELSFQSPRIDATFTLYTAVPPGASEDGPVVFVLDGDNFFAAATGWETQIRGTEGTEPAVIVGIGYGYANSYRAPCKEGRWRDLSIVPDDRCMTGGAATFVDVLSNEIVPTVLSELPGSEDRLALWGHSLGGRTALWTLLTTGAETFAGYVAVDGAAPEIIATQAEVLQPGSPLPVHLFHMFGAQIAEDGQANFDAVNARFTEAAPAGLDWTVERPDADHGETMSLGLERGLGWLLPRL